LKRGICQQLQSSGEAQAQFSDRARQPAADAISESATVRLGSFSAYRDSFTVAGLGLSSATTIRYPC
jgi:hypothetical protein